MKKISFQLYENWMTRVCCSVTSDNCFFPFLILNIFHIKFIILLSYGISIHQKECNAAELVHSRTYELNDFKVEGERRKLDLPAQKNLLTNYFCILLYKYLALHCYCHWKLKASLRVIFFFFMFKTKQLFSSVPCIFRRKDA